MNRNPGLETYFAEQSSNAVNDDAAGRHLRAIDAILSSKNVPQVVVNALLEDDTVAESILIGAGLHMPLDLVLFYGTTEGQDLCAKSRKNRTRFIFDG